MTNTGIFIVDILFGKEFIQSYNIILILLPGVVLGACSRILANDMAARGRPELNLATSWITVSINICMNIYLIPLYGAEGDAFETSFAYSINTVMRLAMHSYFTKVKFYKNIILQKKDFMLVKGLFKASKK